MNYKCVSSFDSILIALLLFASFVRVNILGPYNPSIYIIFFAPLLLVLRGSLIIDVRNFLLLFSIFFISTILWVCDVYDSADYYRIAFNIVPSLALVAVYPTNSAGIQRKTLDRTIIAILIFYIAEVALRFLYPEIRIGDAEFYAYKYNSFMYGDSNFTALALLSMLWFVDYTYGQSPFKKVITSIIILLIVATFSRAVYFAVIIYYGVRFVTLKKVIILGLILFALVFALEVPINLFNDESLNTKFEIFEGVITYISNNGLVTLLTGSGLEKFQELEGTTYAGHSIIYFIFVSFGVVNSILICLMFSTKFKKKYWTLYIPQIAASLSLLTYYFPYITGSRLVSDIATRTNED